MKSNIKNNPVIKFMVSLVMPLLVFLKELFIACKGRRLTVLWMAALFSFIYISSQYYSEKFSSKFGIAVDISNISSNDHILFKVNKGIRDYKDLKKGEFIAFKTDKLEPFVSQDYTIIKKVIGKQGDRIQIVGMNVLVNGHKYAELNPIALNKINKTVSQMQTDYIVPENSLFVLGSYKRSYDSRYWGVLPIKRDTKLDIATPILF
ncbi:signal peptidase I [Acinetobacter baumannii]